MAVIVAVTVVAVTVAVTVAAVIVAAVTVAAVIVAVTVVAVIVAVTPNLIQIMKINLLEPKAGKIEATEILLKTLNLKVVEVEEEEVL